ncbi:MAG: hypothetical protein V1872_05305 [bacterium]
MEREKLTSSLISLKENYGCAGIKMGTEAEANSFEEIEFVMEIVQKHVPVLVKIGGPDARNDIKELLKMGVDGLIAPMVESSYGFKLFIKTLLELAGEKKFTSLIKGINVETKTAYQCLDEIFSQAEVQYLNQITIGRGDLSSSFGREIEDQAIFTVTRDITRHAQKLGIIVSIGGGITPDGAEKVAQQITPDKINTRHVIYDLAKCRNITEAVYHALNFEIDLLSAHEKGISLEQSSKIRQRIEELKQRQACYTTNL